jgi:hypothetical protein
LWLDGALYAMPKFRYRDGGNFKPIVGQRCNPTPQTENTPFPTNHDICIKDDYHLLTAGFSFRRAACRSRCQARAILSGNSAPANTSAKSRPEQTLALSGTNRAKGAPFLRRTKVTFW